MKRRWVLNVLIAVIVCIGLGHAPAYSEPGGGQGLETAIAAQEQHTDALLAVQGVVGTGVGFNAAGQPAVKIFTEAAGLGGLPAALNGVPVDVQVTGKIFAIHHREGHTGGPGGGGNGGTETTDPTSRFDRPVPIGVSSGNEGSCSAGTIGARITDGIDVYALSNNHVYALENTAPIGSRILQPGRFDTNCAIDENDVIGTLDSFVPIDFSGADNTVDAAIAFSSTADLGNATPSNGYGTPKSVIVDENVGLDVQKYGRTTALTKGRITAILATVNIGYNSGTARFVDQIIVESTKPFIKAGDSGSLLVTDPDRHPVGLLFAGNQSGKLAVANPIDLVLDAFGISMIIDGE